MYCMHTCHVPGWGTGTLPRARHCAHDAYVNVCVCVYVCARVPVWFSVPYDVYVLTYSYDVYVLAYPYDVYVLA